MNFFPFLRFSIFLLTYWKLCMKWLFFPSHGVRECFNFSILLLISFRTIVQSNCCFEETAQSWQLYSLLTLKFTVVHGYYRELNCMKHFGCLFLKMFFFLLLALQGSVRKKQKKKNEGHRTCVICWTFGNLHHLGSEYMVLPHRWTL